MLGSGDGINMKHRDLAWFGGLLMLIATASYFTLFPASVESVYIDIDLERGRCSNRAGLPVKLLEGPRGGRPLLRLSLDGSPFRRARFEVAFGRGAPEGWSVHIGDSRTNNGWGGDAGTQTHDSEIQLKDDVLSVWCSDLGLKNQSPHKMESVASFLEGGDRMVVEVANEFCSWESQRWRGSLDSAYLFALAGQKEHEGTENHDVFAAFNRTIGSPARQGSGVTAVRIELSPY